MKDNKTIEEIVKEFCSRFGYKYFKRGVEPYEKLRSVKMTAVEHYLRQALQQYGDSVMEEERESVCRIVRARIGMIELDRKQMSDTNIDYRCSVEKQNELASLIGLLETQKS